MPLASRIAVTDPKPHDAPRTAWLFPGRIELALAVNWRQGTMETMVQDLRTAREHERVKDLSQIAGLRLLSDHCATALARCRLEALATCD